MYTYSPCQMERNKEMENMDQFVFTAEFCLLQSSTLVTALWRELWFGPMSHVCHLSAFLTCFRLHFLFFLFLLLIYLSQPVAVTWAGDGSHCWNRWASLLCQTRYGGKTRTHTFRSQQIASPPIPESPVLLAVHWITGHITSLFHNLVCDVNNSTCEATAIEGNCKWSEISTPAITVASNPLRRIKHISLASLLLAPGTETSPIPLI